MSYIEYFKVYNILKSVLILIIGWWIINKISKILLVFLNKSNIDTGIISFLNSCSKFSLRMILIAIIMSELGFNINSILTAIGASFIAVGISLKDSLSNFISGMVLIITKPIHVGDLIEFENFSGTVMKIEMLFTTLQTQDISKTVIIPNTKLVSNCVVRKSQYNISKFEFEKNIPEHIINKSKEIIKFLEKEILINTKICEFPKPEININNQKLHITVWYQDMYASQMQSELEKITDKLSFKFIQNKN